MDEELESLLQGPYAELPSDATEAFIVFENRIAEECKIGEGYNTSNAVKYITPIEAFIDEFEISHDLLGHIEDAQQWGSGSNFPRYRSTVDILIAKFKVSIRRNRSDGITDLVQLNERAKEEIRCLVNTAKSKLNELSLDVRKKDILFLKLNRFLDELDREQTKLTAFTVSMLQVAKATGEAAKELEPVSKLFEKIQKAIGQGTQETKSLPEWEDKKCLPAPPEQIEDMRDQDAAE